MGVRAEPRVDEMDPSAANADGTDDSSIVGSPTRNACMKH